MRVNSTGPLSSLNRYMEEMNRTAKKIASGRAINSAADNPATAAIAEKMNAIINELSKLEGNAADYINMAQTAEGGLSNITDIMQRMRELAVQASNSTLTNEDRAQIQAEFEQLRQELDRISTSTQFNEQRLLDVDSSKLGLDKVDLVNNPEDAIKVLDEGLKRVSSDRGNLGAVINAYKARISNLQVQRENTVQSYSRMVDVDMAEAITQYTNYQTLTQVGISAVKKLTELMKMKLSLLA